MEFLSVRSGDGVVVPKTTFHFDQGLNGGLDFLVLFDGHRLSLADQQSEADLRQQVHHQTVHRLCDALAIGPPPAERSSPNSAHRCPPSTKPPANSCKQPRRRHWSSILKH